MVSEKDQTAKVRKTYPTEVSAASCSWECSLENWHSHVRKAKNSPVMYLGLTGAISSRLANV